MAERLDWRLQFDLVGDGLSQAREGMDRLQSTLKAGQKAMIELEVGGKKVNFELTGMADKAQKVAPFFDRMRDSVQGFAKANWAAIGAVTALGGAVALGISKLDEFGDRAIKAFGERQGALRAYSTLFGSQAQAEREFNKAGGLAAKTDLTFEDTLGSQKKLAIAGFRGGDLDRALLSVADVASMAAPADRTLTMERLGKAFADVKSKGKLQGEELKQLSEAGIGRGLIASEIAKTLKLGDNAAAEKAISGGKVTADVGIAAIQNAILKQFGTKNLGEYAVGASGSLSGLMSNRDEALDNQLRSINSEALPSVQAYKASLTELNKVFDLSTEKGQNLSFALQDSANTSIALKSAWTDFTAGFVDSFSESYSKAMQDLGINQEGLNSLGDSAKALGFQLGQTGTSVFALVHAFEDIAPVFDVVSGTVTLFTKTLTTAVMTLSDLIYSALPEFVTGRSQKESFLSAGKRLNDWGAAALNGGFEPGKAPWEIRERRERERAEQEAKGLAGALHLPGTSLAGAFDSPKKRGAGGVAGGKGSGGGGGLGSFDISMAPFVPDYSDMRGGMSLPGVSIPGMASSLNLSNTPYAAALQRDLAGGIAARGDASVTVENVEIVIDGASSPQDIADQVAKVLRGMGRYSRSPSPGNL